MTIAENINTVIPDAVARLYRIPYEQLTPDRRVARFEEHEPKHPASYTFARLVDRKPDRWFFRRPPVPHGDTEWEVHAHPDNTYRWLPLDGSNRPDVGPL